jgi:hypothetical protein
MKWPESQYHYRERITEKRHSYFMKDHTQPMLQVSYYVICPTAHVPHGSLPTTRLSLVGERLLLLLVAVLEKGWELRCSVTSVWYIDILLVSCNCFFHCWRNQSTMMHHFKELKARRIHQKNTNSCMHNWSNLLLG